jgi:hypothetical protein
MMRLSVLISPREKEGRGKNLTLLTSLQLKSSFFTVDTGDRGVLRLLRLKVNATRRPLLPDLLAADRNPRLSKS